MYIICLYSQPCSCSRNDFRSFHTCIFRFYSYSGLSCLFPFPIALFYFLFLLPSLSLSFSLSISFSFFLFSLSLSLPLINQNFTMIYSKRAVYTISFMLQYFIFMMLSQDVITGSPVGEKFSKFSSSNSITLYIIKESCCYLFQGATRTGQTHLLVFGEIFFTLSACLLSSCLQHLSLSSCLLHLQLSVVLPAALVTACLPTSCTCHCLMSVK
jgi:hypothetical protein